MHNFSLESEYTIGDKVKFIRGYIVYGSDKRTYICPECKGHSTEMLYCRNCGGKGLVESNNRIKTTEICIGTIQAAVFDVTNCSFGVSYHIKVKEIEYFNIPEKQILGLIKEEE